MNIRAWSTFTFHYASTLSCKQKLVDELSRIYIPLCFYFIEKHLAGVRCFCLFTFHYASTLSFVTDADRGLSGIYIPLCFYFIGIRCCPEWTEPQFTFHYASTLSDTKVAPGYDGYAFTFHYASTLSRTACDSAWTGCKIYIPLCFYFIQEQRPEEHRQNKNLHSTMLLLYRVSILFGQTA